MAVQAMERVVGKARSLAKNPPTTTAPENSEQLISSDLLKKIKSSKVKTLCEELNYSWPQSPNATALLMRTVLLLTLQIKMGNKAKEDLGPVLRQAISQDIYNDKAIKKILTNLAGLPKTLLDATHHSQWMMFTEKEINHWLPGLVKIVEATYP